MKKLLDQYENKNPEIVFEWSDSQPEAKGWVVINSLRGGAAGGGYDPPRGGYDPPGGNFGVSKLGSLGFFRTRDLQNPIPREK